MIRRQRNLLVLGTSAMALILPSAAWAQDAGAADAGDIIVTARRVEERLQDVPISITVFSQEAISNRNIVNAADLATYTPSLSVNSRFGPEKASFAIRGFVQDLGTAPSVGVYFADVVGPRGSSTTTGGNGVGIGNLFDLQNVQVLKGPQGTLFGRNTTGGAVLLVPHKPTDRLEGYVEGSAGNYDMWRFQGVLNLPLSDTFKVRLGVDRMKRQGYLRNHSSIGPKHMADTDYVAARLSILADLTPSLENYTIATYADSDNNGTTLRVVGCKRPDPTLPGNGWSGVQFLGGTFGCRQVDRQNARGDGWWDVENSDPNPRVRMKSWQVINTTTWKASDAITVKNIVSYAELREDTKFNIGGDYWLNADGSFFRPYITIGSTPGYDYGSESTLTEELQVQGQSANGKLKWQTGGYMEVSDPLGTGSQTVGFLMNCTDLNPNKCQQGYNLAVPLPTGGTLQVPLSNLGRHFYRIWWRTYGLYAQATYNFTEQLALTGGIRHTWDSHRHEQANISIRYPADNTPVPFCSSARIPGPTGPGSSLFLSSVNDYRPCLLEFEKKSKAPTWVIDLTYKPTSDVMLYTKWSRGYRAGGVNTPFTFFELWGPEKVDNFEVGTKTSFNSGAVRGYFNLTGFYTKFQDQQIQATLTPKVGAPGTGGTGIINAGKSRMWGFEADAAVTLFDRLRVDAGYTYLNTKLQDLVNIPAPDNRPWQPGDSPWAVVVPTATKGTSLALSPKHRLQLTGTYTLPLDASLGELSFGATYVYTAKQVANRSSPFGGIPATNLVNLNASWKDFLGQPVDLAFFMTNATKEKFPLNVGNSWNSAGYDSVPVNEPRMWGFRLKYRFGS